jgi:hypothetical protein
MADDGSIESTVGSQVRSYQIKSAFLYETDKEGQ